jgi:hypothetical protein
MTQLDVDLSLYGIHEWLIGLLFLALMVVACETGYRLGLRSKAAEKTRALVPTVAGSILALLGLLLGFSMSMSVSRYDTRRRLVLEEANAIETSYLWMQALASPESTELQETLRQYAANRLRVSEAVADIQKLQRGKKEDARLQNELWSRAAAIARKEPQSIPAGLLLKSLNEVIDLENSRWISFVAHLPESVIHVDALMGLVAVLMVGYGFGMTGHRHALSEVLLIVAIFIVMALIVELDYPYSGVVRVSQKPLVDLQYRLTEPGH